MAVEPSTEQTEMDAFFEELASKRMDALWRREEPSRPGGRRAPYAPAHWSWGEIRPMLERAGQLVKPGPDAARRVIQLINPSIREVRSALHTLTANVQMVLPGEIAPSHRHTNAAIRFIIEGEAAVTIVNGEPVSMSPGDLVLTPGWHWHGHVNQSSGPMLWMDTLDRPLLATLRIGTGEPYPDELQPATKPMGHSSAHFGGKGLRPVGERGQPVSPLFLYRWAETEQALHELAKMESDPFDDVAFDYVNPTTGGHVMPTIGCRIQMLRPGFHTRAHRHSYASVFHVFRGSGSTIVDGVQIDWSQGDFVALPPLSWHEHLNRSDSEPAFLYSSIDEPVIEALNLLSEDEYAEHGGYQPVTSKYSAS